VIGAHGLLVLALLAADQPRPLLQLESDDLVVEFLEHPDSHAVCGGFGALRFNLRAAAQVTLTIQGSVANAGIDGAASVRMEGKPLSAGTHELSLRLDPWTGAPATSATYRIEVRELAAPAALETVSGQAVADLRNPAVLRVGRTVVAGVDLLDGHLTRHATDIQIPGRHIGLQVTRIYASTARGIRGPAGAGWASSFALGLAARPGCGLYAVGTADGSTITFLSPDGRGFEPQRGYHSRLTRDRDGSFDFVDKAAVRQHFSAAQDAWGVHRLEYFEEPHGDRLVLRYDSQGRAVEVAEVQREGGGVTSVPRTLRVGHKQAGGFERIAWVDAPGLDLRVEYEYDIYGNLTRVTRHDEERERPETDSYGYSVNDARDRHQLLTALFADGRKETYRYLSTTDRLPGAEVPGESPLLPFGKFECVAQTVTTPVAGKGSTETTTLAYDHSQAAIWRFRAVVAPGPGAVRYLLNPDGNPLEIDEPLGRGRKIWQSLWDSSNVTKTSESDSAGFRARYSYDDRGNLITQVQARRAGAMSEEVHYAYDQRFSKLAYRKDARGGVSTWDLDPQTGALIRANEAGKDPISYRYDPQGRLTEEVDARGRRTVYSDHDTFGYATRIVAPDGRVRVVEYDLRGRRIEPEKAR
jgi:YD repeat-containing protein